MSTPLRGNPLAAPPTTSTLWAYALPGLPLAALTLPVYIFVPAYYGELGVPLALIGYALLAVRLLDAVTDPLIGFLSDRLPLPYGRRKPWLVVGIVPTLLAVWMVFVPPAAPGIGYLLGWSAVLSIGWTLIILPYTAWGAELAEDYDGRTAVTGHREGLVVVGTLLATATPAVLDALGIGGLTQSLRVLAVALIILLPLATAVCLWRVPAPRNYSVQRVRLREGLAAIRHNKAFARLIAAFLINGWANGLPASLFVLYVTHVLVAPQMVGTLLFVYFLAGMVAIPGWLWLARRWNKHQAWVTSMLLACVTFIWVPFLGAGDVMLFALICVVSGFAVGGDLILPGAIQADVVDVDTAQTGEQRTGLYFAMWSLATKLSLALAAGIAFPLLALFGFQADTAPGPESANGSGSLFAVSMLYAGLPVILKLPALVLMWNFPLSRDVQARLRAKIAGAAPSSGDA